MKKTTTKKRRKRKRLDCSTIICWIIVPIVILALLIFDGIGLYKFNTERLLVLGVCVLIILIPLFSEINIKNISFKKEDKNNNKNIR